MLKVGLTGGIGSGKSLVANLFNCIYNIPLYQSDQRAKQLMVSDAHLKEALIQHFGLDIYLNDGSLNRTQLSYLVFNDASELQFLNSLVHPAVERDFDVWCSNQSTEVVIKEAAILFESGAYKLLDKIIAVSAPMELRINRVMERDGSQRQQIEQRIAHQWKSEEIERKSDFVIYNDEERALIPQIHHIYNLLLSSRNK